MAKPQRLGTVAKPKPKPKVAAEKERKAPAKTSPPSHPPYLQMVMEAIVALKERTGSSSQAIANFIQAEYGGGLPPNFKKMLSLQLKKLQKSEKLTRVKNSYKLAPSAKAVVKAKNLKITEASKSRASPNLAKDEEWGLEKEEEWGLEKKKGAKSKRLSQVKSPNSLKVLTPKKSPKSIRARRPVTKKVKA
ncbi:histone H1 [Amborella trichopoda]|uniref:H15 domain-containing protein n=1 Tax=Amborella trichopoda TaxID=13333 RepID=U5D3K3_AMBTC|nr:histone H1 [Amborella trichopoda]ERN16825.1 hypothetical protein AMTR_s00057p00112340 [Amborella trichopoda]|eukprot:XP_006855358.1 histone H1 [Amborella trichopoda]